MEDKKLNNAITEIKSIVLTDAEKKHILKNVLNSPVKIQKPTKSPWGFYSFTSIRKYRFAYTAIAVLLIILLGGREAVFASEVSLPGNILYPFKVRVVEPIKSILKSSPEAKALYESELATKRLVEAEALAKDGKLDDAKEKELDDLLANHTVALNKNLDKIRKENSKEDKVDDIVVNFQAGMNAHARVLDVITTSNDKEGSKEQKNKKISETARKNGNSVRSNFKNKKKDIAEKYNKRKKTVQSLIDKTTLDLDDKNKIEDKSDTDKVIIDDTEKTLNRAKQFLNEAEKEVDIYDKDTEDSYSKLLDSESSAKEADIFFKTGLRLKAKNKLESNGKRVDFQDDIDLNINNRD